MQELRLLQVGQEGRHLGISRGSARTSESPYYQSKVCTFNIVCMALSSGLTAQCKNKSQDKRNNSPHPWTLCTVACLPVLPTTVCSQNLWQPRSGTSTLHQERELRKLNHLGHPGG